MSKQTFTREEVLKIVDELLESPDPLIDAVSNENPEWDAETLLELAEGFINRKYKARITQVCKTNCDNKSFKVKVGGKEHTFCCQKGFEKSLKDFAKTQGGIK